MARAPAERGELIPVLGEIFREHGYEGASLSVIGERTGLGKGSLYHFFPGGKAQMAAEVLDEVGAWFEANLYRPLRQEPDPRRAVGLMRQACLDYFRSGRRVCLVGAFALDNVRDRFAAAIRGYFIGWIEALTQALQRGGLEAAVAQNLAEGAVADIQGALVLSRALDDPSLFVRSLGRIEAGLLGAMEAR
ncbi:MAG: TetR/AcrR family transcriptional regulator [Caulobacteraceae bacterium]|nr:TetR/AcrR family transcriptional regulator [Caulobacteraceae bacterium]